MLTKRGKQFFIVILVLFISYLLFRVPENEVIVYEILQFSEIDPKTVSVLTRKSDVRQFTYAARFATKQRGEVDIAAADFRFYLGNKQYELWVDERYPYGTLMKHPNSSKIYKIIKHRTKKLLKLLQREYMI